MTEEVDSPTRTLICFSHLRWHFVFQRPHHLMRRFAATMRVFFVEEPVVEGTAPPRLGLVETPFGVVVATPFLPATLDPAAQVEAQRDLLDQLCAEQQISNPLLWYYTPIANCFSSHLRAEKVVYDCMDELSGFRGAPPNLLAEEKRLFGRADLVFCGGRALYEAKRPHHPRVHAFPSSVDVKHFHAARRCAEEPADQAAIPHPRIGYAGVIDDRLDTKLLGELADQRPDWQFIMLGPVVPKIDDADLPRRPNVHYLGIRPYETLPAYLAGWDVAMMPFARNEATRFISPTKTPEYLAAGRPVVSTPITDVVADYGARGLVRIAENASEFAAGIADILAETERAGWLEAVDQRLRETSWDATWAAMVALLDAPRDATPARLRRTHFDYLIVGAGFAGSVLAERLADAGKTVLLADRRPHIGGNAYDEYDRDGILVHRYGPHIFHTNSAQVFDYLSRFTEWRPYEHRVLASVKDKLVPIPINLTTINTLYGLDLDGDGMERFLAERAEPVDTIRTSEDVVVARVGRELYEMFFAGYTRKQWGIDPSQLDKSVTARVPTRTDTDDRYFLDSFQAMPRHGYTRLFENLLDHDNIEIALAADYRDLGDVRCGHLIYTGPVDEFFDYRFGRLPYRSLRFRHETHDREWFQPVAVVNYPSPKVPHTRITEYKHLTGQRHPKTSISYEFPCGDGDPYYPVPCSENAELYRRYRDLADATPNVSFVGRLATYRYYNMDQVIAQALAHFDRLVGGGRR